MAINLRILTIQKTIIRHFYTSRKRKHPISKRDRAPFDIRLQYQKMLRSINTSLWSRLYRFFSLFRAFL